MTKNTPNLFSDAKNAAVKVLKGGEKITISDLESIFRLYGFKKSLSQTLSQSSEDIKNKIINSVNLAVESLSEYLLDSLKMGKESFTELLIDELTGKNLGKNLETLLTNPNQLLPVDLKLNDNECIEVINEYLVGKIYEEFSNMDKKYFDSYDTDALQSISGKINNLGYLDKNVKGKMINEIQNIIFGKISPEIEKHIEDFKKSMETAITQSDTNIDVKGYKDKFMDLVRDIENKKIIRGSTAEALLQKCKTDFETQFDNLVSQLISQIIKTKLKDDLDNCDSSSDIDMYMKQKHNTYGKITSWLKMLNDEKIKTRFESSIKSMVEGARITCKSKPPRVKTIKDNDGNEYALFKNEEFPISKHKTVTHTRKIEPKLLENGNVLITFRNVKTGNVIEPSDGKRLRLDNSYEITQDQYKDLLSQMKPGNEVIKEFNNLKEKLQATSDKAEREELQNQIKEYFENKLPFFMTIAEKLKTLDNLCGNYILSKIPDFDPNCIKITPDVMENLIEIAECSKTMLLGQKDILIIEGEAGVGKNVLIDIFAHFTNRPVFVFACGKKTDSHDLTYQWILDEKGSKKLNSRIYEAIHTPGSILVLDEINTMDPGTQKKLNALFDKRKELVSDEAGASDTKALPDVLIFGTMNPVSYEGTQKLADDVASRSHFIFHDYDWMFNKDGISYSDALRTYGNVNYFWKMSSWTSMRKEDSELYEQALLDLKLGKKLSKNKENIMKRFKPLNDADFIWARNQLFNGGNEEEVKKRFPDIFVEGMKDIYQIILYSNYIRARHKACKSGLDCRNLPWDEDENDLFAEKSFSPRLAIQALEQLNNGNEITSAKQAVIQTYIQQVSELEIRDKLVQFFNNLSDDKIEKQLKDKNVSSLLYSRKIQ